MLREEQVLQTLVMLTEKNKKLTFKNNAPFRSCTSKISNAFIDNEEDVDVVISMCNLLEYSNNYSMTSESLWNYYTDYIWGILSCFFYI